MEATLTALLIKEEENLNLDYTEQVRQFGTGLIRVGTFYECDGDIYTLAILS